MIKCNAVEFGIIIGVFDLLMIIVLYEALLYYLHVPVVQ